MDVRWVGRALLLASAGLVGIRDADPWRPSPEEAELLLGSETAPHERRQLGILRTDSELFERCLKRLRAIGVGRLADVHGAGASRSSSYRGRRA